MNDRTDAPDNSRASGARVESPSPSLDALSLSELLHGLTGATRVIETVRSSMLAVARRELDPQQRVGFHAVIQVTLLGLMSPDEVGLGTWREAAQEALWRLARYDRCLAVEMIRAAA